MSLKSTPLLRKVLGACALALLLAGVTTFASAAGWENPADSGAVDARDAALVNAVKLNMDLVTRVGKVAKQTHGALDNSCLMSRGPAADRSKSLEACADSLGKVVSIRQALVANGLTARQFTFALSAVIAAAMSGQSVLADPKAGWDAVREFGINPEQVRFYLAHHAEIDRITNPDGE
ncbi:MAG: hypothetical protein ACREP2_02355 [Rhodanobacteraceae bacterium]